MKLKPCFTAGFLVFFTQLSSASSEPQPGDVFKEFSWHSDGDRMLIIINHDLCTNSYCPNPSPPRVRRIEGVDLDSAVRAEVVVENWSGHIGTSAKAISFNGNPPIQVPLPANTPTSPECYLAMSQAAVAVPLAHLEAGVNNIGFSCDQQICNNFNYPAWAVTGVTLRVFYHASKPHVTGAIVSPLSGGSITENTTIEVETQGAVDRVELIAEYEDFDWEGNGVFRQWHYRYWFASLERHLGTSNDAPHRFHWDARWIPDQQEPVRMAARIISSDQTIAITPAVSDLFLARPSAVEIHTCSNVQEGFSSRVGQRKTCSIDLPDLSRAEAARLVVSASAPHEAPGEIGIGNTALAVLPPGTPAWSNHEFYEIDVPLSLLSSGANPFFLYSETTHHSLEVYWPGPALLVRYLPEVQPDAGTLDAGITDRESPDRPVETDASLDWRQRVRINCGDNRFDVPGWMRDDSIASGGEDWVNTSEVDVSGVSNAAPAAVYRSVRRASPHSYSMPVPEGLYTLRFHFADSYDLERSLSYTVEDKLLISDLNITERAGINRALVLDFEVRVRDGNGLQIEATGTNDVFEAGLELIPIFDPDAGAPDTQPPDAGQPEDASTLSDSGKTGIEAGGCGCSAAPDDGSARSLVRLITRSNPE